MPYVRLEDIGQGTGTIVSIGRASSATSQKSGFVAGDILFGKLRPNLKKVARPDFDGICSTDIVVFRAKPGIDPDFAFKVLSSEPVIDHAVAQAAGTKMPRAHARSVLNFDVMLPPHDEQQRIAKVLRSVDEAIAVAQQVSQLEARLGGKLVGRLFAGAGHSDFIEDTPLGPLPSEWSVREWGTLCSLVGVGIASSATHAYSSKGIPLIRNQNILFGSLDLTDLLRVTAEYDQQYTSKRLKSGDVITMRTGYPGRSAVVPPELDGCQTFTTLISRPKQELVLPGYLCGWINSERGRREVLRLQAGGAQQNLNAGSLQHLLVPVPPIAEQHKIVATLQGFVRNPTIKQSIVSVRDAISSDLLSGRVRVPVSLTAAALTREVQPAFKRAVFAAEVVRQLHRDDRFGSVKHEKIVYLCELHLGLQNDLDRHAYKEAAGPYDPNARRSVERIFRQQKWFNPTKQDKRIVYQPLEASGGHSRYFDRYFGDRRAEVQELIDLLRPLKTQQCEIVATLYAVWNDFLLGGGQPSDDEIVDGVFNNWTDSKRQIPEEKWRAALPWMRQKKLIPAGRGEKTRVAAT